MPWIKIADATRESGTTIFKTRERIKLEGVKSSVRVYPDDLILSNSATPGIPKFVGIDACIHDGWLLLRDFDGLDKHFAYWLLLNERPILASQGNGSVFTNLKTDILKTHVVSVPGIDEQRRIAKILDTIQDKIANNRALAADFEAMARAIFKSWFIDFAPVKAKMEGRAPTGLDPDTAALFPDKLVDSELGLIPKGWEVVQLSSMAEFLNGLALQKYPPRGKYDLPVLKIAQLRARELDYEKLASSEVGDRYRVRSGDLIFSWSGSLLVDFWAGSDCALNQHLFKVNPEAWANPGLLWAAIDHHIEQFREIAAGKAVTMGHINRRHLNEAKVALPPRNQVRKFCLQLDALTKFSCQLEVESQGLAKLRDLLLPRLISGRLRLPAAEPLMEETAA